MTDSTSVPHAAPSVATTASWASTTALTLRGLTFAICHKAYDRRCADTVRFAADTRTTAAANEENATIVQTRVSKFRYVSVVVSIDTAQPPM